jgi:predicted metal-dependent hydrolase
MDLPERETVELPGVSAPVHWRRSTHAKRVSLRIDIRHGAVVVTLPWHEKRRAGIALLRAHSDWIKDRLANLPQRIDIVDGATVPFLGEPHRICHRPDLRGVVTVVEGALHVTGQAEFLRRRVLDFLREEAKRRLKALAGEKAQAEGLAFHNFQVKDTRTRWGSCTSDGCLSFSWRLVMAPIFVQDYVAAHEVAHLRHMNHGPRFWELVDRLTPHTRAAQAWVIDNGAGLQRVG